MLLRLRPFLISALIILCTLSAAGADVAAVQQKVQQILSSPELAHGAHGCVIRTLDTGAEVFSVNPDKVLMTASNMKLLTSAAALDILGPDFRYTTKLLASAPIGKDGVLDGDLILVGSGDPVLGTEAFASTVEDLRAKGLKRVTGGVIADTGNFDRSGLGWGWSWDYLSAYYAAPAGGLNFNKNVMNIVVQPGEEPGSPARVTLQPGGSSMRVRNSVVTGEAGSRKSIYRVRDLAGTAVTVSGAIPVDASSSGPEATVAVADPAQFAAESLRELLRNVDIPVEGRCRTGEAPAGAVTVSRHVSKPLSEIVVDLNKWSDNLIAECLLRTIGSVKKDSGSISSGRSAAYEFFEKRVGMDMGGVDMADGSGLSRLNLVSCGNIARLLVHMYSHKSSKYYIESLPVAGVDGTLRNRMKGTPAEGSVKAKTGYIGGVSSLSGYVTSAAGQPFVFSIIFNNQIGTTTPCLRAQNEICAYLAGLNEKL